MAVRQEVQGWQARVLTAVSFLAPLVLWCLFSYSPFLWHPDVKLLITADRDGSSTVFVAGDHLSRDYFPEFVDAVRTENTEILRSWTAGDAPGGAAVRRQNRKNLRQLAPVLISNGALPAGEAQNDDLLADLWGQVAEGTLVLDSPALTQENLRIVQANWARIGGEAPLEAPAFSQPLLKLLPQGRSANPVYLPAPHEVVRTGWRDFTADVPEGQVSMGDRLLHSVRIVFMGFLLSCLIAVPIGVLCGTFDFFSRLFEPFIDFFRYMPAPVFSTLLVAVFLAHDAPKIALVFIGTFFQMVLVISKTTRLLEPSLLEAAQTLGANRKQLLFRVVVPGIMPNLYNDLRILLGWSWTWLVIAELIGVKSGLTEFIETQGRWRNFDRVYPVIILIGLLGFFTDQVLAWLHRVVFPWTGAMQGPATRATVTALMWVPRWFADAVAMREPYVPLRARVRE